MKRQNTNSNYRFVESIEENRPNSTYQMDIDQLDKEGDFVVDDKGSGRGQYLQQGKQLLNPSAFSGICQNASNKQPK